jgi:hypothetical protein
MHAALYPEERFGRVEVKRHWPHRHAILHGCRFFRGGRLSLPRPRGLTRSGRVAAPCAHALASVAVTDLLAYACLAPAAPRLMGRGGDCTGASCDASARARSRLGEKRRVGAEAACESSPLRATTSTGSSFMAGVRLCRLLRAPEERRHTCGGGERRGALCRTVAACGRDSRAPSGASCRPDIESLRTPTCTRGHVQLPSAPARTFVQQLDREDHGNNRRTGHRLPCAAVSWCRNSRRGERRTRLVDIPLHARADGQRGINIEVSLLQTKDHSCAASKRAACGARGAGEGVGLQNMSEKESEVSALVVHGLLGHTRLLSLPPCVACLTAQSAPFARRTAAQAALRLRTK